MAKLTTKLLRDAARAAERAHRFGQLITAAFEERYGATHSAIDCDELIDTLDYGYGGSDNLTVRDADRLMTASGHPPLKRKRRSA